MDVPIIPGRVMVEEAIPTLLNPANNVLEQMVTVTAGTPYILPALKDRQQVIIQVQTAGTAVWIKWGGGSVAVNDGMYLPAGAMIGMKVVADKDVTIIADSADSTLYILQLGGVYE